MQGIIDSFFKWTLAVDWVPTFKDWAVIFKDLSTGGAAIFAIANFILWKRELKFKQRNEVATKLMKLVYQIQDAFYEIFSSILLDDETYSLLESNNLSIKEYQKILTKLEHLGEPIKVLTSYWDEIQLLSAESYLYFGFQHKILEERLRSLIHEYVSAFSYVTSISKKISEMDNEKERLFHDIFSSDGKIFFFNLPFVESQIEEIDTITSNYEKLFNDSLFRANRK